MRKKRQAPNPNVTIVGRYASYDEVILKLLCIKANIIKYFKIIAWMRMLEAKHPNLVKLSYIGKTFENRDLIVLEVVI